MSENGSTHSNVIGIRDVYEEVRATRTEINTRFSGLESRIDRVESRQDRNDGRLDMLKWLGPTGVLALVVGLLYMSGVLPTS